MKPLFVATTLPALVNANAAPVTTADASTVENNTLTNVADTDR